MESSWSISKEIEKPFRQALNHASKRQVGELRDLFHEMSDEQMAGALGMCGWVSAYVAIDVVSRRWPTDAGLRRMSQKITEGENRDKQYGVTEQNLYRYLSQCALGFKDYGETFSDIFEDEFEMLAAPFFFTINLLTRYHPKEVAVSDFLNTIESAYEGAWLLDLNVLPALMVRARMP